MIKKSELKKKSVEFIDKCGQFRIATVLSIRGNTLTVATVTKINKKRFMLCKEKIHPDDNKIFGVYYRNKLQSIDWSRSA